MFDEEYRCVRNNVNGYCPSYRRSVRNQGWNEGSDENYGSRVWNSQEAMCDEHYVDGKGYESPLYYYNYKRDRENSRDS